MNLHFYSSCQMLVMNYPTSKGLVIYYRVGVGYKMFVMNHPTSKGPVINNGAGVGYKMAKSLVQNLLCPHLETW